MNGMDFAIPLGSEVVVPSSSSSGGPHQHHGAVGTLRFVGQVRGRSGIYAGVDLQGDAIRGKNDGTVDGVRYFETRHAKSGLFLPYSKLAAANRQYFQTPTRPGFSGRQLGNSPSSGDSPSGSPGPGGSRTVSLAGLETTIRSLRARNNELEAELKARTLSLVDITRELDVREAKLAKQKQSHDRQRDELREAVRLLEAQAVENERLYQEEIEKLARKNNDMRTRNENDEYDINHEREKTAKEMLQLKTEIIEAHRELQDKGQKIKSLEQENAGLQKAFRTRESAFQRQIEELKKSNASLSRDLEAEKSKKAQEEEIARLTQELEQVTVSSSAGYKAELDAIHRQHDIDLHQKQKTIDSLSKKILELDTDRGLTPTKSTVSTPAFRAEDPRPLLKNIVNSLHDSPASPSSAASGSPKLHRKRSVPVLHEVASNITINENSISQLVDGELMVYIPETKVDPSAGREKWCGLCERQGHDSVDCALF